ncbi:MAG: metallophosphoesterase family protein [Elainella sp. Prado103]|nr:metallophosphoesterase family protein [Elainella sp. Prado103]
MARIFSRLGSVCASHGRILLFALIFLVSASLGILSGQYLQSLFDPMPPLLTDPFLQSPTANSVRVVWFTEFPGTAHWVEYGTGLKQKTSATTTKLSRMQEDARSRVGSQTEDGQVYPQPTARSIWRHEAEISGLTATRIPYRVVSLNSDHRPAISRSFTLAGLPSTGTPLKILLTSDHQQKPMAAANLQQVSETVGQVDAVFFAGDLVDVADRASEWFDDNRGNAFFPILQGRGNYRLEHNGQKIQYTGGAIIQSAPLFPAIGNHEVMGRVLPELDLNQQFNDPIPRWVAQQKYAELATEINPTNNAELKDRWIENHSFNTDSYEEIFTLPDTGGGKKYYAITIGDVRLISLFACNIWRVPGLDDNARGRYRERAADLNQPDRWGYGQHIFEPITPGSAQYIWLERELNSPEFQQAKYRVVMFHHPIHSLGENVVPAYTDPVQTIERTPEGTIAAIRYEYPLQNDYLVRDVVPLLEDAGVQLVFYGHSHVWNRFVSPKGMHFLESSNVGNTYGAFNGAFNGEKRRPVPIGYAETYAAVGDPNGLQPIMPTVSPLLDGSQQPQPYIASNEITAFSILDTGTGSVRSYRFDTHQPGEVVLFDEFPLLP